MAVLGQDDTAAQADQADFLAGWREVIVNPAMPSIARVYDYWLGGDHNLVADRQVAETMATLDPWIPAACRANRAFLGRAVRYLAGQGVRQFLDIGSGIPTAGNMHEVAQQVVPDARVVYVDRDPVAVAESEYLLAASQHVAVVEADIRDPRAILSHPLVRQQLDFSEPVAIMLVAVLHFVLDADSPYGIVARLRDAAVPGSYLVVSHATSHGNAALAAAAERIYNSRAADGQARSLDEIARFFGDWEMADPGLVYAPQWRPGSPADVPGHPERFWFLAGVARKQDQVGVAVPAMRP
jgi:hypothetical protein